MAGSDRIRGARPWAAADERTRQGVRVQHTLCRLLRDLLPERAERDLLRGAACSHYTRRTQGKGFAPSAGHGG